MGEILNLLFQRRENDTFDVQVRESWSGRSVSGTFTPPYKSRQLNVVLKKLNTLEYGLNEMRDIGNRLFQALCGTETPGTVRSESSEHSVQAVLRSVTQRTLRRRGTVALTLSFAPGCEEFIRYPWELLHNGEHFLLASGVFTLTRVLLRPGVPSASPFALPVYPPLRVLYMSASPQDCQPLDTERSYAALRKSLADLLEQGHVLLDSLEQVTFDDLVEYLNTYGGASALNDGETAIPCYVVHFDGHGAYGRLCGDEACEQLNDANARTCVCGRSLKTVKPQTYLCFCDAGGNNKYIDTESLCDLFTTSDVRLAVFSACETAALSHEPTDKQRRVAVDATPATALMMAQVPAVVAMPFSLYDDLSPTFIFHFYQALATGHTLEEALSRARQAMLPEHKHRGWFVPVLYRHMSQGQEGPVALLAGRDTPEEHDHPLAHLGTSTFVGRERELRDIEALLTAAASGRELEEQHLEAKGQYTLRPGVHHLVLTGPAGIGKSALAVKAVQQNHDKFPGGIIGVSLRGGKSFTEALVEIGHPLHILAKTMLATDQSTRESLVLNALRSRASRELPCLLLLDRFEEVKGHSEVEAWLHFLCLLPEQVVVLTTSQSNPASMGVLEGIPCHWYEYSVGKMTNTDLLALFGDLAMETGLAQRIHLDDPEQQAILQEICTLLDGYPLGAELIFGTAQSIEGKIYTPEAATRSLEEVRDELKQTPLAGIWAALEVAYLRLTPPARLLLAYLSALKLPFSHEQIVMLVAPGALASARAAVRLEREHTLSDAQTQDALRSAGAVVPTELEQHWRAARDELVGASFMQFDGRVYMIHPQVRRFAISHLPLEERRRVHRVAAAYYSGLPQPSPDQWFVAFEHLEDAAEPHDLQEAVNLAVNASWALCGRGYATEVLAMLRRAEAHAFTLGDKTGEGKILCCLGALLRLLGRYAEAVGCLTRSLALHREHKEADEAGWALYELARLFREEGHFEQANHYAQEALNLFRDAGDATGEAWMHLVLGGVSRGYGRYHEALGHFERALTGFRTLHDEEGIASTLRDRGTVHEALGNYSEALADAEEALRLFKSLGLRFGQAWVLTNQCVVYTHQDQLGQAEVACREAIAIFREQGIRRGEGRALYAMGEIARQRGSFEPARRYCDEALAIFVALGDGVDQAQALNALGAITVAEGDYVVAQERYEHALAIAQEQGARQIEGRSRRGLGDIARVMHNFKDAERYYYEALTIANELDTRRERCAVLRHQGELYVLQGRYADALACWRQALTIDLRMGHPARQYLQDKVDALIAEHHLQ